MHLTDLNIKSKCTIDYLGTKRWYLNGLQHRVDGPAVEHVNGDKYWYLNGLQYRIDGPAVEYVNGTKQWYLNGKELTFKQWLSVVWDRLSKEDRKKYGFNGFEYEE